MFKTGFNAIEPHNLPPQLLVFGCEDAGWGHCVELLLGIGAGDGVVSGGGV
jgi:hypothetical protein